MSRHLILSKSERNGRLGGSILDGYKIEGSVKLGGISADKISYQISPQPLRRGHGILGDINTVLDFRSQHLGLWKETWEETHSCHTTVMTPSLRGHHLIDCRVSRPSTLPPQVRANLGTSPLRLCHDFVTVILFLCSVLLPSFCYPSKPLVCHLPALLQALIIHERM